MKTKEKSKSFPGFFSALKDPSRDASIPRKTDTASTRSKAEALFMKRWSIDDEHWASIPKVVGSIPTGVDIDLVIRGKLTNIKFKNSNR